MILDAITYAIGSAIAALLSVFPFAGDTDEQFVEAIASFSGYINMFDAFIPVDTVFTVLQFIVLVEAVALTFRAFKWAVQLARGAGS
jgi:hypothetical protein